MTFNGEANDPYLAQLGDGTDRDLWEFGQRFIAADSNILDIGANLGVTSCILADLVPKGRVCAVEAGLGNYRHLVENLDKNGHPTVEARHCAVSDAPGTLRFVENWAYGGIADGILDDRTDSIEVPAVTVDGIVAELGLDRVDLIKIDVEGAEPRVLRGAHETVRRCNPIVLMEFNAWALIAHGKVNPVDFAAQLIQEFEYVGILGESGRVAEVGDAASFVHDHLVGLPQVTDLVLRRRGAPQPADTESLSIRGAAFLSELRQTRSELEAAQAQLAAVKRSHSWAVTEPLRRLSDATRRDRSPSAYGWCRRGRVSGL
jgi:FkbM family methyltransferase